MKTSFATIGKQKYKTEIQAGNHIIMADEPEELGGGNLGFTPTELLESSLAACTAMTIRMYADRKGWDLEQAEIKVGFKRNMTTGEVTFKKEIELFGNLSGEEREKLLEMGSKCPIERMITGKVSVTSDLT
ncbi:MAG: osmotically inducible protein OsmC [Muricauda sp.]|nr:OsmC family protein [uncultured Allomuricauda sp.]MBC73538.1 osmotically inducible protein OsmC [Allomuricauda sp.]|tara:strand:+ start:3080 stop:3472 length:393 start_codon:yes stop_codon:yes gene_type:complete